MPAPDRILIAQIGAAHGVRGEVRVKSYAAEPDALRRYGELITEDGRRFTVEKLRPALEQYEAFCRDIGTPPADVGLAWLLHQPAVTAPIVGPRTMEQFEGALSALEVALDDSQLARLDEIFPGYKPAPMEYAW